jgi:RNA polymerase sigma-70 factor (ECF subfamily)
MNTNPFFETLAEAHLDGLRKYCFYLTKSKWDGEDLYQEVLLRTMLYFLNTKPNGNDNVKSFVTRVARNLWIDNCRASQRRRRQVYMQHLPVCYMDPDYAEVRDLMEWMAEHFPRRNIEMWLLSEYFGYTMQEIADTLGSSLPAVKSVLFRTRELLRRLKDRQGMEKDKRKVMGQEVELWSRAILQDQPQYIWTLHGHSL